MPARSKGCITCRQRKVKCDEGRPSCSRCRRSGRTCAGYDDDRFINILPAHLRVASQTRQVSVLGPRAAGISSAANKPRGKILERRFIIYYASDESDHRQPYQAAHDLSSAALRPLRTDAHPELASGSYPEYADVVNQRPSQSLDLISFKDDIFVSFALSEFMRGLGRLPIPAGSELLNPEGMLNFQCVLAISTSYFGSRYHDHEIMQLGRWRYGDALAGVNKALRHPVQSKSLHILGAVTVLMLHELFTPTSYSGWVSHSLGLERLIVHCGPETFTSDPAHLLFVSERMAIILACVALERPCLIDSTEWKTVPWRLSSDSKDPYQDMLDVIIDLPRRMQPLTRFRKGLISPAEFMRQLHGMISAVEEKAKILDEWGAAFTRRNGHKMWEIPVSYEGLGVESTPTLWTTRYGFHDLYTAHEYTTYQSIKVLIMGTLRVLESYGPDTGSERLYGLVLTARAAGIEICRSLEFHLNSENRNGGSVIALFPIRMAWKAFGGLDTPEARWLAHIMSNPSEGLSAQWRDASAIALAPYRPTNHLEGVGNGWCAQPEGSQADD